MKAEGMPQQDDRPSECQNCEITYGPGCEGQLQPIDDLFQRVSAGEPMPSGQCEYCGALCQLLPEKEDQTVGNALGLALAFAREAVHEDRRFQEEVVTHLSALVPDEEN